MLSQICADSILKCMYNNSHSRIVEDFSNDYKPKIQLIVNSQSLLSYELNESQFYYDIVYLLDGICKYVKVHDLPVPLHFQYFIKNRFLSNFQLKLKLFQVWNRQSLFFERFLLALSCLY